jgi:hypothetical protein
MHSSFSADLSRNTYIASLVNQGSVQAKELANGNDVKDRRRKQEARAAGEKQFSLLTQTTHTQGFTA